MGTGSILRTIAIGDHDEEHKIVTGSTPGNVLDRPTLTCRIIT